MNRWLSPMLVGVGTAVAAWYLTPAAVTYGIMSKAVSGVASRGGFNHMAYGNMATPKNQPIVRPSPDLAYSTCAYDLSDGPLQIDVHPVAGHYSSLSVFDARTDVVFVRNDIQAKGAPYRVVIARVGQSVPAGTETVRVNYDKGIALIRLLLSSPTEIDAMEPARRLSTCGPVKSS